MVNLAPVVLFAYARPEHTRKTVESLAVNDLAVETDLIVYSDAARGAMDAEKVQAVRDYLKTIDGFRSVTIHERERNFGLADSIIDGVTVSVDNRGKVIVVEDDLITSPYFIRYMNDALQVYQNEERVMHIAAHMFDINSRDLPEAFFLPPASCWGWGTWARAWRHFNRDSAEYIKSFRQEDIFKFNLSGSYDYWRQLLDNHDQKINTWAVFWYASVFTRGGLCLHPRTSMVCNIGFDGSGTNCGTNEQLSFPLVTQAVQDFPRQIETSVLGLSRYEDYLRSMMLGVGEDQSWWCHIFREACGRFQTWIKRFCPYINHLY